ESFEQPTGPEIRLVRGPRPEENPRGGPPHRAPLAIEEPVAQDGEHEDHRCAHPDRAGPPCEEHACQTNAPDPFDHTVDEHLLILARTSLLLPVDLARGPASCSRFARYNGCVRSLRRRALAATTRAWLFVAASACQSSPRPTDGPLAIFYPPR